MSCIRMYYDLISCLCWLLHYCLDFLPCRVFILSLHYVLYVHVLIGCVCEGVTD